MLNRDFEGVWFPADLYLCRDISFQEKAFLIEFKSLSKKEPWRGCYAQNRHFSEQFDLSVSRVSEIINSLAGRAMITIQMIREGKQIIERRIFLTEKALAYWTGSTPSENTGTPSEKAKNPFGKGEDPPSEKAKENSTKDNNTSEGYIDRQAGDLFDGQRAIEKATRATRWDREKFPTIPKNFQSEALRVGLTQTEALDQYERFSDYWSAKSGKDGTKLDWTATWRTWCRNFLDRRGGRPSGGQGTGGSHRPSGGWSSHLPRGYDAPQGGQNGGPTIIEGEFTAKR